MYNQRKKRFRKNYRQCCKVACRNIENGHITCGIIFPNGKMAVGDDCWRLSNIADTCDHPFKIYNNSIEVEKKYIITHPEKTIFFDNEKEESNYDVPRHHS